MGEYDPGSLSDDQTKKGWLTAILELGAWAGTLLSGFLAEVISRKYGILVACSVFILGVVIQATAATAGYQVILPAASSRMPAPSPPGIRGLGDSENEF